MGFLKARKGDWLHRIIGMVIFLVGWWKFNSGIGLAMTTLVAILKELNDKYKIIPFLLTSKNEGKADTIDIANTMLLPMAITILDYLFNITDFISKLFNAYTI